MSDIDPNILVLNERIEELEAELTLMTTERDEAWKRAAHAEKMWGECLIKLKGDDK